MLGVEPQRTLPDVAGRDKLGDEAGVRGRVVLVGEFTKPGGTLGTGLDRMSLLLEVEPRDPFPLSLAVMSSATRLASEEEWCRSKPAPFGVWSPLAVGFSNSG